MLYPGGVGVVGSNFSKTQGGEIGITYGDKMLTKSAKSIRQVEKVVMLTGATGALDMEEAKVFLLGKSVTDEDVETWAQYVADNNITVTQA